MQRPMSTLHDLRHAVVFPNPLNQLGAVPIRLRDEDVTGPLQIGRRLPQGTPREHEARSEGSRPIHQHNIVPVLQLQVLKSVIQDQHVRAELLDGRCASLHPILVHHHWDTHAVRRQHPRFIARLVGIEQDLLPIGNNPCRWFLRLLGKAKPRGPAFSEGGFLLLLALVTPAQNRHATSLLQKSLGQQFHHRGLARASDGEVSDADHRHTQMMIVNVTLTIEKQTQRDNPRIHPRKRPENDPQHIGAYPPAIMDDHINDELFEVFERVLHESVAGAAGHGTRCAILKGRRPASPV